MKVVVLGLGYLGATHAACMAELGHEVLGVEVDPHKREMLSAGEVPFYEPGLPELLGKHIESGKLHVTASYSEAADFADVFFIAVGTPQKKGEYAADLKYVEAAIHELVPILTRDALILGKSTVPVGTAQRLGELADELAKDAVRVEIAWNPEFLREGYAINDTLRPDRLVLGAFQGGRAEEIVRKIYKPLIDDDRVPFIVTDPPTAELVKTAANAFLATKISFINAIAEICDAAGADIQAIANAMGYDERIGRRYLNAGLGFGGGCLPKDIRAFMARAGELGAAEALSFLREVDATNIRRRNRAVEVSRRACGGSVVGRRIAVLGAAFKPESDDVRDSPALNVAGQLQLQGASVAVYDPRAMRNASSLFPTLEYNDSARDCCLDADLVMILTEWTEFKELDPDEVGKWVRVRNIFDGRMCLEKNVWIAHGWNYVV